MKHSIFTNSKKRSLPLAIALAFGLTACSGEQFGETNDGQANIGTGVIGDGAATSILLLGGVVGLAAILSDSDNDSGVVVTTAGDDATGGNGTNTDDDSGNNEGSGNDDDSVNNDDSGNGGESSNNDGSGNGGESGNNDDSGDGGESGNNDDSGNGGESGNNDGSGNGGESGNNDDSGNGGESGNNDDSGNGGDTNNNDDSDNDDAANNPNNDSESTLVPSLEAPDWLLGMWRGTGSDGVGIVGSIAPEEIGVNPFGMPMINYSNNPEVCLHLVESNGNVFEYTVWYPGPGNTEVLINEQWINNGDGTVLYTVNGATNDQFTMYSANAGSFLAPPSWLQGQWATQSVNGSTITIAFINEGNIIIGNQGEAGTNYYELADQPLSVVRVLIDDNTTYSFEVTTVGADGNIQTVVTETFKKDGANTITYTGAGTPATMTRQ